MAAKYIKKHNQKFSSITPVNQQADLLEIVFYTDPLCCWSWGFEPQWRKFLYQFQNQLSYRYCMSGLLPGWQNYHDTITAVSRPIQMGPVWMHAQQLSGMPMDATTWMRDAPLSSYPACIAVKSASMQSTQAEEIYLRLLREAIMIHGKNISKEEILMSVAIKVKSILPAFDTTKFQLDLKNDNGLEAFRKDLQEVRNLQINRFPTLVIRGENNKAVMISGHRPYSVLLDATKQVKELKPVVETINENDFLEFWPFATERELTEIRSV
ncbi:MAG: DsbA family protein [Bacteroidota bacterium]